MTRTRKTKTVEIKEPSRKPEASRETMMNQLYEYVRDAVEEATGVEVSQKRQFMESWEKYGPIDAISWESGRVVKAGITAMFWTSFADRLLEVDNPASFLVVLERMRAHLLEKLMDKARGDKSTSTFHNAADEFVAEAVSELLRFTLPSLTAWAERRNAQWDTAPATEQEAWDALSVTEKVEYLTWKTAKGLAHTEIEAAWTPRQEG
jgi:hypothetical protein